MFEVKVAQLCLTLCHCMDCSPQGSVHGILQARILEWVAMLFSRGSSRPRDWTQVFCIAGRFFTVWAIGGVLWWGLNWWKALWIHYPFALRPSFTQVSSRNMNSIPVLWEINFFVWWMTFIFYFFFFLHSPHPHRWVTFNSRAPCQLCRYSLRTALQPETSSFLGSNVHPALRTLPGSSHSCPTFLHRHFPQWMS